MSDPEPTTTGKPISVVPARAGLPFLSTVGDADDEDLARPGAFLHRLESRRFAFALEAAGLEHEQDQGVGFDAFSAESHTSSRPPSRVHASPPSRGIDRGVRQRLVRLERFDGAESAFPAAA
jgi:hypothetical protein